MRVHAIIPLRTCSALVRRVALSFFAAALAACGPNGNRADPHDAAQVAKGRMVYEMQCAACHGRNLEGQPAWQSRLASGRMPAPPHDDTGHTWHHPDAILFGIVKHGLAPPYGPPGYQSDMPAFGTVLSDADIWSVLAYIKSRWSPRAQDAQARIDRKSREK
jgi:mono/diheme cytochrome c family protein